MTPTTGVDPSGKASAEGLIGMLERCTRATMLGGPFTNAKCDGRRRGGRGEGGVIRFGTHAYCMRALVQDRNLFWPVWVGNVPSKMQSQEHLMVILELRQVGSLEVAQ